MHLTKYLLIYITTLISFLILDGIWLGIIAKNVYFQKIGHLISNKPNILPAVLFYLLFVSVLTYMVLIPAINEGSLSKVLINGALFGFITYATYDLTNQATLKDWPVFVTIIDILWGTFVTTTVSIIVYQIFR